MQKKKFSIDMLYFFKKPDTDDYMLYDSIYAKCPEKAGL